MRVCVRSVGTKKTSKNVLKNMYPRVGVIGGLVVYFASLASVSAKVTYMTFFGLIVQYVQIQNYLTQSTD